MKTTRWILILTLLCGLAYFVISRRSIDLAMKPRIEIHKSARQLVHVDAGGMQRKFPVALGSNPVAPKEVEGDGATPEGVYFICCKNPQSSYFLSLGISYPGPRDAERGLAAGLISEAEGAAIRQADAEGRTPPWKTALGGEVFIHGRGSKPDWTLGCVALDDADMADLYDEVEVGTPVIILP